MTIDIIQEQVLNPSNSPLIRTIDLFIEINITIPNEIKKECGKKIPFELELAYSTFSNHLNKTLNEQCFNFPSISPKKMKFPSLINEIYPTPDHFKPFYKPIKKKIDKNFFEIEGLMQTIYEGLESLVYSKKACFIGIITVSLLCLIFRKFLRNYFKRGQQIIKNRKTYLKEFFKHLERYIFEVEWLIYLRWLRDFCGLSWNEIEKFFIYFFLRFQNFFKKWFAIFKKNMLLVFFYFKVLGYEILKKLAPFSRYILSMFSIIIIGLFAKKFWWRIFLLSSEEFSLRSIRLFSQLELRKNINQKKKFYKIVLGILRKMEKRLMEITYTKSHDYMMLEKQITLFKTLLESVKKEISSLAQSLITDIRLYRQNLGNT